MASETKTHSQSSGLSACQSCKQDFVVRPEDFKFYEKIKVPPPTWCPDCRTVRRMVWRNERALYRRKCDAPGHTEEIISIFSPSQKLKVYDRAYWWSDAWDPMNYGRDYDFSKPFFQQFKELLEETPLVNVFNTNAVNSEYCNHVEDSKDCYLLFASIWNENVSYSRGPVRCKDSFDLLQTEKVESCYDLADSEECFKGFSSREVKSSNHSMFLLDCRNCSDCFGCINIRNKTHCFFNQQYPKEEYDQKIKELDSGSYKNFLRVFEKFNAFKLKHIRRFAHLTNTVGVIGDHVSNTKNCYRCFSIFQNTEDCAYLTHGGAQLRDSYDSYGIGAGELMYEVIDTGIASSRVLFIVVGRGGHSAVYGYNCHNSDDIFACVGLRNKSYCILNKQYTKEEYEKLVPRIIEHMNQMPYTDKKGIIYKYGEFFPPELSPFSYNETIAQEYFPLLKEEALEKGYSWKDPEERNYEITLQAEDLPDHIKDVSDSILKEIIGCAHQKAPPAGGCNEQCTEAFRIIPQELQFLRKMNLPLPRLCPNCRHYQRIKARNPLKLWKRKCQCAGETSENKVYANTADHIHHKSTEHCPNEFETTYAPERPEIVYCEECYLREVV